MFHSRDLNNKINSLYERSLYVVYSDNRSTFEDLLDVLAHAKYVKTLALEVFKVGKNLSAPIASEFFEKRISIYDLWNPSEVVLPIVHNVHNGIESIS